MSKRNTIDIDIRSFIRFLYDGRKQEATLPEVTFLFLERGLDTTNLFLNLTPFELYCCKKYLVLSKPSSVGPPFLKFTIYDLLDYILQHKELGRE